MFSQAGVYAGDGEEKDEKTWKVWEKERQREQGEWRVSRLLQRPQREVRTCSPRRSNVGE